MSVGYLTEGNHNKNYGPFESLAKGTLLTASYAEKSGGIHQKLSKAQNTIFYARAGIVATVALAIILAVAVSPVGLTVGICAIVPFMMISKARKEQNSQYAALNEELIKLAPIYASIKEYVILQRTTREGEIVRALRKNGVDTQMAAEAAVALSFNSYIQHAQAIIQLANPLVTDTACIQAQLGTADHLRIAIVWNDLQTACRNFINPNPGSETYVRLKYENGRIVTENTNMHYEIE